MMHSVKSSRDNTKGHPPQLVGDPSGYKAVVGDPSQQVYFVLKDGVVDKRCYNNFENADRRLEYFKQFRTTRDYDIAKSSLSNWKIISGYEKAINIWKEDQQDRITQGHRRPRLSEFERGIKEWHKKNNPPRATPPNKNLQRQPQPLVETVEQAINNPASPAASPPKISKVSNRDYSRGYKSLYIVECKQPVKDNGCLIKIGVSNHPQERIRGLQIGSPFELQFVYKTKDSPLACSLEKWLHRKMEDVCERGEWFKLNCLQLENLKNFLANYRLINTLHWEVSDKPQEAWDSLWEEHRLYSEWKNGRNVRNKKEEADE